jgi:hypothetical protein
MKLLRWGLGVAGGAVVLAAGVLNGPGGAVAAVSTGSAEAAATYSGGARPVVDPQSLVGWCEVGESLVHGGWSVRSAEVSAPTSSAAVQLTASRPTVEETEYGPREGWLVEFRVGDLDGQDTTVAVVVTCER